MTPGSAPAAGGEGDGPRLPPPSLSAGSPSPEPHLVRSSGRSCSFFPAGVWGRGGEGGTHTRRDGTRSGCGRPGCPPTAGACARGGRGAGRAQAASWGRRVPLPAYRKIKRKRGMAGMFISSERPPAHAPPVSKQMEEFDWRFLRQTRLISLRDLGPFCVCWVKKRWKEREVCRGENKTESECSRPGLGLQKEDNKPRFPLRKRSVRFYSHFCLKGMGRAVQGKTKQSLFLYCCGV